MNWIEIDKILHKILKTSDSVDDAYVEAEKQFKWSRGQSKAAIDPLLKSYTFSKDSAKKPRSRSKKSTKANKSV